MIRRAIWSDLKALESLERACFADFWSRKSLSESLNDEKTLVLVCGEPIFAYLVGWNVLDEAEIARVGVEREFRGQGIGKKMLTFALEEWKNCGAKSVWLEVRESNFAARKLYEKCGFEVVGRRANYYSDGETAVLWKREI